MAVKSYLSSLVSFDIFNNVASLTVSRLNGKKEPEYKPVSQKFRNESGDVENELEAYSYTLNNEAGSRTTRDNSLSNKTTGRSFF